MRKKLLAGLLSVAMLMNSSAVALAEEIMLQEDIQIITEMPEDQENIDSEESDVEIEIETESIEEILFEDLIFDEEPEDYNFQTEVMDSTQESLDETEYLSENM